MITTYRGSQYIEQYKDVIILGAELNISTAPEGSNCACLPICVHKAL